MSDVAKAAGLSPGALYTYVEGKDALFHLAVGGEPGGALPVPNPPPADTVALVQARLRGGIPVAAMKRAARSAAPSDATAELRDLMGTLYDALAGDREFMSVVERSARDVPGLAEQYYRQGRRNFIADFATYLRRRAKQGVLRRGARCGGDHALPHRDRRVVRVAPTQRCRLGDDQRRGSRARPCSTWPPRHSRRRATGEHRDDDASAGRGRLPPAPLAARVHARPRAGGGGTEARPPARLPHRLRLAPRRVLLPGRRPPPRRRVRRPPAPGPLGRTGGRCRLRPVAGGAPGDPRAARHRDGDPHRAHRPRARRRAGRADRRGRVRRARPGGPRGQPLVPDAELRPPRLGRGVVLPGPGARGAATSGGGSASAPRPRSGCWRSRRSSCGSRPSRSGCC